ncbi:MAG: cytochrome c oxidase assembly protein [Acidimicrobiales bacterium]
MTALLAADVDVWEFELHPEVWLIVAAAIGIGWYVVKVIAPHAVPAGTPAVTTAQKRYFVAALAALYIASAWPVHDIAEEYLYSVHMIQHLLITFVVPPLFLLATPTWLARLVVSEDGESGVWVRRLAHPVVAGVLFNAVIALTHLPWVVNTSVENGPFHYFVHLAAFAVAMLMWIPVAGPLPELRLSLPGQMIFLFTMSIIPTVPAGFLTFAEGALYDSYDHDVRLWGVSIQTDQQTAGLIMKVVGGLFLWTIIAILFFRWAKQHEAPRRPGRTVASGAAVGESADSTGSSPPPERTGSDALTFDEVERAFRESGPAPVEQGRATGDG